MTVKQLIEELNKFPEDMPVTIMNDINPEDVDDPHWLSVEKWTWTHDNYPYNKPDFDYINLQ